MGPTLLIQCIIILKLKLYNNIDFTDPNPSGPMSGIVPIVAPVVVVVLVALAIIVTIIISLVVKKKTCKKPSTEEVDNSMNMKVSKSILIFVGAV